jgi:hypothetical protein
MLGEILGRKAGLTSVLEEMLPRFLLVLLLSSGRRADTGLGVAPRGDVTALASGVFLAVPDGVLSGPVLDVLRADKRGVASPFAAEVSILPRLGRPVLLAAGSGREKSSSIENSPSWWSNAS